MGRPRSFIVPGLVVAVVALGIVACALAVHVIEDRTASVSQTSGGGATSPSDSGTSGTLSGSVASESKQDAASVAAARLTIRDVSLRLQVAHARTAIAKARSIATRLGGSVTSMQLATASDQQAYSTTAEGTASAPLHGTVTIRIPAARLGTAVAELSGLGTLLSQSESSEDVTQQHIDLTARLANLRVEEKRLREFFASAKKVSEMLAIEQELSRVRGEIESLAAQTAYLERQAAMATVTLELVEPTPLVSPQGEDWGFGDAVRSGIRGAVTVLRVALQVLIAASPLLVLGAIVLIVVVRRRRARRAEDADDEG